MPFLSSHARRKKLSFFLPQLPRDARILEVGSGDGWLGSHLKSNGWTNYTSIDNSSPADIRGDVNDWQNLGLEPASFDTIIAFEVVEHGDFYDAFLALLRPGGLLFLTTPLPAADPLLRILEHAGLNQKRTSPHSHLHHFRDIPSFEPVITRTVAALSQWGVFRKPTPSHSPPAL